MRGKHGSSQARKHPKVVGALLGAIVLLAAVPSAMLAHSYARPGVTHLVSDIPGDSDDAAMSSDGHQAVFASVPLLSAQVEQPEDDCAVPGFDDRCEKWVADAPSPNSTHGAMGLSPAGDRLFTVLDRTIKAHDTETGDELWEADLQGDDQPGRSTPVIRDLEVSPDGRWLYAAGYQVPFDAPDKTKDKDVVVAAYDASTGEMAWRSVLGLPGLAGNDRYESVEVSGAIAVSPDGRRVYVAGQTYLDDRLQGPISRDNLLVAAYDASTGKRSWLTTHGEKLERKAGWEIEVSPDSRTVYVGGEIGFQEAFLAVSVRAFAPQNPQLEGSVLWESSYKGLGQGNVLHSMDLAPDGGRLYLAGWSEGDYATVAFLAATGERAWASRWEGTSDLKAGMEHTAYSVVADPMGERVFVTGRSERSSPATVAYDASTGAELWSTQFSWLGHLTGHDELEDGELRLREETAVPAVTTSPDGSRVYVAGTMRAGGLGIQQHFTAAYDASTGQQAWVARYFTDRLGGSMFVEAASHGQALFVAGRNVLAYEIESEGGR